LAALRALIVVSLAAALWPAAAGARESAIFYYPWYGTEGLDGAFWHWNQNGHEAPMDIASNFFPVRGAYSSGDPRVINEQMAEIARAGVDTVVVSWWGPGSVEDRRLGAVLRAARARGLRVAIHLEPYRGRTVERTRADVAGLRRRGVTDFYLYRPGDFTASEWLPLTSSVLGARILAQTSLVGYAAAGGFDGVYTYDILVFGGGLFRRLCTQARRSGLLCAPSVGPGYVASRATRDGRVKPRRKGRTYDSMWRAALGARADLVTITSYNEWHEGTQIEPARSSPPAGYLTYRGAYGLRGKASERAYLQRTRFWTRRLARA
jgi:glycoprotein endo-alpha-1,2-mannosidase